MVNRKFWQFPFLRNERVATIYYFSPGLAWKIPKENSGAAYSHLENVDKRSVLMKKETKSSLVCIL